MKTKKALSKNDDGFHADLDTVIHGGTILVEKSYEGLEGKRVVVNGGDITVNASDDGANAAGSGDDDSNAASSNDDSSAVVNSGDDSSISGTADGKEPPQMPPDTENGSDMQPSQDFDPENKIMRSLPADCKITVIRERTWT